MEKNNNAYEFVDHDKKIRHKRVLFWYHTT